MLNEVLNNLRCNPRLRLWLALIVAVIGFYGILVLRDALQEAEQQQRSVALGITRLRAQLAQTEWLQRLPAAKIVAVQLEGRLWQAPTAGLAQAALQDWLNTALMQAKATKTQVTVTVIDEIARTGVDGNTPASLSTASATTDGTPATPSDLWKIKAKVGFDFTAPSLLEFLNRIENHDKQIVLISLNVRKDPPSHVELELLTYFQKQMVAEKARLPPKEATSTDRLAPATARP